MPIRVFIWALLSQADRLSRGCSERNERQDAGCGESSSGPSAAPAFLRFGGRPGGGSRFGAGGPRRRGGSREVGVESRAGVVVGALRGGRALQSPRGCQDLGLPCIVAAPEDVLVAREGFDAFRRRREVAKPVDDEMACRHESRGGRGAFLLGAACPARSS